MSRASANAGKRAWSPVTGPWVVLPVQSRAARPSPARALTAFGVASPDASAASPRRSPSPSAATTAARCGSSVGAVAVRGAVGAGAGASSRTRCVFVPLKPKAETLARRGRSERRHCLAMRHRTSSPPLMTARRGQGARHSAVAHGHHHLDDASHSRRGLGVADVDLERSQPQRLAPVLTVGGEECLGLDQVAQDGAGAARLDDVHIGRVDPGVRKRLADESLLCPAAGCGEPVGGPCGSGRGWWRATLLRQFICVRVGV